MSGAKRCGYTAILKISDFLTNTSWLISYHKFKIDENMQFSLPPEFSFNSSSENGNPFYSLIDRKYLLKTCSTSLRRSEKALITNS